jgi:hypothetical protein
MIHYLKFTDEAAMQTALSAYYYEDEAGDTVLMTGDGAYSIDVVGLVYQPTGETLTDEYGNEYPETKAVDGWHVNWLGDLPESLNANVIDAPATPACVFAGYEVVAELESEET